IYGVVVIYTTYVRYIAKGKKITAYAILIATLVLWSFEASGYITLWRAAISRGNQNYEILCGKKVNDWKQFLFASHYKPDDFQAILLLRFFSVGSEKLWLGRDNTDIEIAAGIAPG